MDRQRAGCLAQPDGHAVTALGPVPGPAPDQLSPALDGLLRAQARRQQLARGQALYARGAPPAALYCVESGAVQLSTSARSGREAVLGVVQPGRWFGELTLFIQAPRVHDARALVDSVLLVVPAAAFHAVVDHRPEHLLEFVRLVCHRYKWAIERIDAGILQPLPARLAQLLLMGDAPPVPGAAGDAAERQQSQESLAQMLGSSRQSVNRLLKQWEALGLLRLAYGRIRLLDPQALQRLAQGDDG